MRVAYAEAGLAQRLAWEKVRDAKLTRTELHIFGWVSAMVGSWSKVSDKLSRRQIAEGTGAHVSTVSAAMARLTKLGILVWVPGDGRGHFSSVTFPMADPGQLTLDGTSPEPEAFLTGVDDVVDDDDRPAEKGSPFPGKGSPKRPERFAAATTQSEYPETYTEDGCAAVAARMAKRPVDSVELHRAVGRFVVADGPRRVTAALEALMDHSYRFTDIADLVTRLDRELHGLFMPGSGRCLPPTPAAEEPVPAADAVADHLATARAQLRGVLAG